MHKETITIEKLNEIKQNHIKEIMFRENIGDITDLPYRYEVMVCSNTSCLSVNSKHIREVFENHAKEVGIEDKVRVSQTGCLGFCVKGPIAIVYPEGYFYTLLDEEKSKKIVEQHLRDDIPVEEFLLRDDNGEITPTISSIPFYQKQKFIARNHKGEINPRKIEDYIAVDGYRALHTCLTEKSPIETIGVVKDSGLKGRGGAGFLTGLKWEFAHKYTSDKKYVVCNADEGDPGAFMDRIIIESNPHTVIEAMAICGYAIGANEGFVYLRAEYPLAGEILENAIKQAYSHNLLGKNIFGTDFNFDLSIKYGAGAFVCGEETALLNSIEGRRGEPNIKPPYPAESGLYGKPTVINNVETLANVSQIINNGADWFKQIGTAETKGTKVFALSGKINHPGIIELPMGTTIKEIVYDIGGGIPNGRKFKAVQMGGPSGGCIPEEFIDTPIDYKTLSDLGSMMGSGGMIVLDEDSCMVNLSKFFLEFICEESCGKCVPCRIGNKRLLEILTKITDGKGTMDDLKELETLSHYIKENSLCGLGQTSPNPVLSTLKYFYEEYRQHVEEKTCSAKVCKALARYFITEKCVGCSACARVCPTKCISGEVRQRYVIDQSRCIKCGACKEACRFNAIIVE